MLFNFKLTILKNSQNKEQNKEQNSLNSFKSFSLNDSSILTIPAEANSIYIRNSIGFYNWNFCPIFSENTTFNPKQEIQFAISTGSHSNKNDAHDPEEIQDPLDLYLKQYVFY